MKKATICFCLHGDRVLLAMKKRGFGAGKWNGYGGKALEGENEKTAAVRELQEESRLVANEKDLEQVALIRFYFEGSPEFECSVFVVHVWQGEPKETEEMRPQWFSVSNLPFNAMWVADIKWIPIVLAGKQIEAVVNFNTDGSVVKNFDYKPASFI